MGSKPVASMDCIRLMLEGVDNLEMEGGFDREVIIASLATALHHLILGAPDPLQTLRWVMEDLDLELN